MQQTWYWTSTTASRAPGYAWHVHLEGGRMFYGDKTRDAMVWPVRGESPLLARTGQRICRDVSGNVVECEGTGQDAELLKGAAWPEPRFAPEDAGVRDLLTGLLWTRSADLCGVCTWEEALEAAKGFRDGGLRWRLPNIRELESLVDAERHDPALPAGHPFESPQEAYWSSTSSAYSPDWGLLPVPAQGGGGRGLQSPDGSSGPGSWPSNDAAYLSVEKFKIRRPIKNGEMQGSEKIQGARCIAHTQAVWIFSLTQQIAVLGRPAIPGSRARRRP